MTDKPYPSEVLTDICKMLMEDWDLPLRDVENLAVDLPGEYEAHIQARNEAAWERRQQSLMESGGPDDSKYRADLINAGRGHLLGDRR